jgi:glycosyltransferase involved in cell wall biosynthesis
VKVLHINTERTWRGGEQQVLYLMRGLAARGVEQQLLCRPGSVISERARAAGLSVWERPLRGELDLPAAMAIKGAIRERGFDVVHMHTSHAHTLGVIGSVLTGKDRPVTVVSRRVDFSIHKRRFSLSGIKYTKGVDRILCVSEAIRRVLLDDGLPAEMLGVVHSGVDLARFDDVPDSAMALREELGVPADAPWIGNVAHCADHKGQRYLVAAAPALLARHPNVRITVVGEGELLADLKAQALELGVAERVSFPGFRTDVVELLAAFDAFCFPSHLEGLGTSVLDAMAMSLPIVASRAGGIPEMIDSGTHGLLVPPKDPAALADALAHMLEHQDEAAAMAAAGRARLEAEFTVDATVTKTLAEYESLLAKN